MAATKECPSCGAQNDVIFTNCMFCKTSLPPTNFDEISNEDLVMKASEWVGKSKEHTIDLGKDMPNRKFGTIAIMKHGEILGNAEKYLNVLALRSISNNALSIVYIDLKEKLKENSEKGAKNIPARIFFWSILFLFIFNLIIILIDKL